MKGFNFAFPSIIWIKPIAFDRPTFGPSSTICFEVSTFIALETLAFVYRVLQLYPFGLLDEIFKVQLAI